MTCSKCGKCCTSLFFAYPEFKLRKSDIDYYKYHNIDIIKDKVNKQIIFKVNQRCRNLTSNNLCRIFKNRPDICREKANKDINFMRIEGCTEE